jgi:hypothetical protein
LGAVVAGQPARGRIATFLRCHRSLAAVLDTEEVRTTVSLNDTLHKNLNLEDKCVR